MNKLNNAVLIAIMGLTMAGCEVDGGDDTNTASATTYEDYRQGVEVHYLDGSLMGVTREGVAVNGGYNIYNVGTGEVVGWIDVAGNVNDAGGVELSVCNGLLNEVDNFNNNCTLTVENPSKPKPRKPSKSSGTSGGSTYQQDTSGGGDEHFDHSNPDGTSSGEGGLG
jgi:hypothetical protein